MWPDGKIMFEEVNTKITPFHYTASAFKILRGENFSEIDFKKISYETDPEGIPVHAFVCPGNVSMRMEAFCSIGRSPVAYTKLRFENHSGKTYLGDKVRPMGTVLAGNGNNGKDKTEGARYKNVFATYSHGSLLPKNPRLADHILKTALKRRYPGIELEALDDTFENNAHDYMVQRLSAK